MNDHCSSIRQTRRRRRRRRRRTSTSPLRSKVSSPLRYRRLVVNNNNTSSSSSSSPLVLLDEDEQSAVILELESDYIKHTQSIGWMFLVVCFMAVILSLYIGYYNYYHHDDYHCSNNKPLTSSYDHKSPSLSSLSSSSFVSICNTGIYYWSCICYPLYVALVHVSIGYVAFWKLIMVVNVVVHNNKEEQGEEEKKNKEQQYIAQQFVKGADWKPNTCLTVLVLVSVLFPVILWLLQLLCWGWRAAFLPTAMLLMAAVGGGGGNNLVIYLLFLYMEKDCQKTLQQVQDLNTFRYKLKSV